MTIHHWLPRAMTPAELALIRSNDQSSMLYLGILKPAVVYTALVNQSFASKDKVTQVTYDTGSGTLGNVLPGMTMYVGTSAGASDAGMVRIRKTPSGTVFYIGENSEVLWDNDLYLTVVDDFNLWARHISIAANVPYMDYDIAYSDQHTATLPIPIIGPRLVPAWILPLLTKVKYNQDDGAVTFTGAGWYYDDSPASAPAYSGDLELTNGIGDYFEISFSGQSYYSIIGATNNILGIAEVYLDGELQGTIDFYTPGAVWQTVLFSQNVTTDAHVVKVILVGKNPSSGGYYIDLDAFELGTYPLLAEVQFDASSSYCLADTSVASYLWVAPGSSSSTGLATSTPTIYYDTPGTYRVSCTVTAANGKTNTAYAHVLVYDREANLPITQFDLKSCNGSFNEGGWKFQISMWAEAELSSVVDRAMVVLFARDLYGTTEVSLGQIPDRENILATGWINGESIIDDPDGSRVDFTVETADAWMKRISGFPLGIQNATTASSAWTNWFNLNVDDSLYHLFYWQSTFIPVIDIFLTGDTRKSAEQYAGGDTTVYDQLTYLLKNTLLGFAGCDRFGRLFCGVDPQLTPPADRASFEVVLILTKEDWRDQLPITRAITNTTSQVNLSGVVINYPAPVVPIFSLAPGHVYTPLGKTIKQDRMLLSSQAQGNELAALKLAWDNHNLEFSPDLAGNNRMVDIFPPYGYVEMEVADTDTPRAFAYSGNVLVREIGITFESNADSGFLQISWRGEQETFPGNSCNGDLPAVSNVPTVDFPPTAFAPAPLPPLISPAPVEPASLKEVAVLTGGVVYFTKNFDAPTASEVVWFSMEEGLPGSASVLNFDISASGRCFCQYGLESIWSAPEFGAPWELVFDYTMIGNPEGYAFPRGPAVTGFGINRDADDELFIMAGLVVTIAGEFIMYTWYGSSGGVTLGTLTFFDLGDPNNAGFASYGDGVFSGTYISELGVTNSAFTASGTWLTTVGLGVAPSGHYIATRGRYASLVTVSVGTDPISISTDSGLSFVGYPTAPLPYPDTFSFCTDATGQNILLGTQLLGMKRSEDGGATWDPTITLAAVTAIENLGTTNDWIFAFIGQVCYTPDFGQSFVYRTGDLQTWAGPFAEIKMIRFHQ